MKSILLALLLMTAVSFAAPDDKYGSTVFATGQQPLSTTAVQVVPAGTSRQLAAIVRNQDAAISIYIGNTAGVTSTTGILLKAGESITINTRAAIYAVAASGTPTAGYLTESD